MLQNQLHVQTQSLAGVVGKATPSTNVKRLPVSLWRTKESSYLTVTCALAVLGKDTFQRIARVKPLVAYARNIIQHYFKKITLLLQQSHFLMLCKQKKTHLPCCVDSGDGGSTSMIVPVWISSIINPERETLVYALQDTQSSNTPPL